MSSTPSILHEVDNGVSPLPHERDRMIDPVDAEDQTRKWSLRLVMLVSVISWTLIGSLFIVQEVVHYQAASRPYVLTHVFVEHLIEWGAWAVLTPALVTFVRRVPPTLSPRWRTVALYGVAALAMVAVSIALIAGARFLLPWRPPRLSLVETYVANFARLFSYSLVLFVLVTSIAVALTFRDQVNMRELMQARLEAHLATARHEVLAMQFQPHFLFNALNTVAGLIYVDPRKADQMITGLSELLRTSLRADRRTMIRLGEELTFVLRYLEIQQARFDERLRTDIQIDERATSALVPTFILQHLVENAMRHAVAVHSTPVTVAVCAERVGDRLHLAVSDDGPGLPDARLPGSGIGLANTRARLEQLYRGRHQFVVENRPGGGVRAKVSIPWEDEERYGS